jgi:hypothetical protein
MAMILVLILIMGPMAVAMTMPSAILVVRVSVWFVVTAVVVVVAMK